MLVEINLLPKKDKQSRVNGWVIGILVFLFVLLLAFFVWQINLKEEKLAYTQEQLSMTQNLIAAKNKQLTDYRSSTSVQQLEQAIKWAETQPFDLVYLLDELTKILPKRGFFTDFSMDEDYKVNQIIQFDTKSEAAYYLHSLLSYEWIDEAVVSETKTRDLEQGNKEEDAAVGYVNEDNVLPRYLAQYEMIINIPKLKEAAEKDAAKKEADEKKAAENKKGDETE